MVTKSQLAKAAVRDPDAIRRLCVWLASLPRPNQCQRELLNKATEVLTVWSSWDDET